MASRDNRPGRTGSPATLLAVLAVAAILAGILFWQLNRQTSPPEAAGAPPAQTLSLP
jgi:hypothetical protein